MHACSGGVSIDSALLALAATRPLGCVCLDNGHVVFPMFKSIQCTEHAVRFYSDTVQTLQT